MAWTYRAAPARACELKAVAPPPVSETGARSGLSARAPAFALRVTASTPSATTLALAIVDETQQSDIAPELLGGREPPPDQPAEQRAALDLRLRIDGAR